MSSFWEAFREFMLELILGRYQLEAWRQERARREKCEQEAERHRRRAAEMAQ